MASKHTMTRLIRSIAISCVVFPVGRAAIANHPEGLELYLKDIKPMFQEHCTDCHGGKKVKGGLDLTKRVNMMQGGDSGAVVVAGDRNASLLYKSVNHDIDQKMPHKKPKLSADLIDKIGRWIDLGVIYPVDEIGTAVDLGAEQARQMVIDDDDRAFWSFGPLKDPPPPPVKNTQWIRNAIDPFVLAPQEAQGLAPSPPADRPTLIRRASFGLLGLPPTPEEVADFVDDPDTKAWENLIDRLLASEHYGERWGRHWLDLARFAESHGYEADNDRPNAWSYRDAVIKALNQDLPYDRFITWQLAGDEVAPDNLLAITLTGFIAAGPKITNEGGDRVKWEKLDDIVSATGEAMLGLSLGCARCHDHKYDPITARDYYGLAGIFANHKIQDIPLMTGKEREKFEAEREALKKQENEARERHKAWFKVHEQADINRRIQEHDKLSAEEKALLLDESKSNEADWKQLRKEYADLFKVNRGQMLKELSEEIREEERQLKKEMDGLARAYKEYRPPRGMGTVVTDGGRNRPQAYFLDRGDWRHKSETDYQFLEVLMPSKDSTGQWLKEAPAEARTSHSRKALAEWITDTQDGAGRLLARVVVNRLWQHHFGVGIVSTASSFGSQGAAPSHPELLDWLAGDLVRHGWSLKRMHKQILMSATYRQSTTRDADKLAKDPANRALSYRRPIRLEAEVLRDSILAVSGVLNKEMYGPSIKPWIHSDAIATGSTKKWPVNVKDGPGTWRRSIYIYAKRSMLMPMMEAFDLPDSTRSCAVRNTTTVAPAALLMLNNAFIRDQAGHLATRVAEGGTNPVDRVRKLYEIALSRPATDEEIALGTKFMQVQAQGYAGEKPLEETHQREALVNYCQAVLALNEFLYIN